MNSLTTKRWAILGLLIETLRRYALKKFRWIRWLPWHQERWALMESAKTRLSLVGGTVAS